MKNTVNCIHLKLLLLLFNLLVAFSCKTHASINNENAVVNDSIEKPIARFIVSFGSICCGIDHKKESKFLSFVSKYKNNPQYTMYKWGEEGERDYCFFLKELDTKEQELFIKKARKLLGNTRLVGTYENISCPR